MMDEHLRDNVERLLKLKADPPSPEFMGRVDSLLRLNAPPRRKLAFLPLSVIAATTVIAFIYWIVGRENPSDMGTSLKGTITVKGELPAAKKYKTHSDPKCVAAHPEGLVIEPVPVDNDRHVKGCLVYVKKGLEGKAFEIPKEPKIMAFDRCLIEPRNSAIMVGQELVTVNRDATLHNVHVLPWKNRETNDGLPGKGQTCKRTFTAPELGIRVKCDVHEWDRAWISVFPHPFYAVTDQHGRFEIKGLPPGKYTLEAWQENCDPVRQDVEVGPDQSKTIDFEMKAKPPTLEWSKSDQELEGKLVDVGGELQPLSSADKPPVPLREGRLYVKVWGGYCGILPESEKAVRALPKGTFVILRGTFRGPVQPNRTFFLLEDCSLMDTPDFGPKK